MRTAAMKLLGLFAEPEMGVCASLVMAAGGYGALCGGPVSGFVSASAAGLFLWFTWSLARMY